MSHGAFDEPTQGSDQDDRDTVCACGPWGALEGFFGSLASEERADGVSVHIAAPSFIATSIGRSDEQPGGLTRLGSATDGVDYIDPDEAAGLILRGLAKGKKMNPIGRVASIAWRLHRDSPGVYQRMMERNIAKGD